VAIGPHRPTHVSRVCHGPRCAGGGMLPNGLGALRSASVVAGISDDIDG